MSDSAETLAATPGLDVDHLRSILARAVRHACPRWLAAQHEDLVQNACLRIVRKLKEAEEPERLSASYIWRVAHSVVMDEVRRRMRHPEEALEPAEVAMPASDAQSPDQAHESGVVREAIEAGLRQMKEAHRNVVLLYLHGFSLEDSARILGWTPKQVDNRRYQGLAELRSYLEGRGMKP